MTRSRSVQDPSTEPGSRDAPLDTDRYLELYHQMAQIRHFETIAIEGLKAGDVLGALHPSIGQEAVASGVCANLRKDDLLLSTHRGHGHTLAKGADPYRMMCELLGRADGYCAGKGGSMHIADFDVGMLGANGVVAANINIAVGAAHGIRLRKQSRIVACFFGDGAINRGPFLEGLNWASVYRLPLLLICEDNCFAATTRTDSVTAGEGALARAASLGIPGRQVDGNDLNAIEAVARTMIDEIRAGSGPQLLLARTYRLLGHTSHDPAAYRDADEVKARWQQDPLILAEADLVARGVTADTLKQLRDQALEEMQDAYARALQAERPAPHTAFTDIQDIGCPTQEVFR